MKILCFSPLELPYHIGARYTGLERLAASFAEEWTKLGHDVTLLAHKDTSVNPSVKLLPCDGYETVKRPNHAEALAFTTYQSEFRKFDVIWDIGHLHLIARFISHLPTANVFSANPEYEARMRTEKAPYNLISWSKWGIGQIRKYYGREARYQETIMVDPNVYKPDGKRGDRFLTLGRMAPAKGNLSAAIFCKDNGLPLDIAGGRGSEKMAGQELTDYEKEVMKICDGKQLIFHGEVSEEEKLHLLQTCKSLLYLTDHVEITSHKVQEALFCGAQVIAPNTGGMPEIVTQGVDGFLCNTSPEVLDKVQNHLHELDPSKTRDALIAKYSPAVVAGNYIKLFEQIANGLRWK